MVQIIVSIRTFRPLNGAGCSSVRDYLPPDQWLLATVTLKYILVNVRAKPALVTLLCIICNRNLGPPSRLTILVCLRRRHSST